MIVCPKNQQLGSKCWGERGALCPPGELPPPVSGQAALGQHLFSTIPSCFRPRYCVQYMPVFPEGPRGTVHSSSVWTSRILLSELYLSAVLLGSKYQLKLYDQLQKVDSLWVY